MKEEKRESNIAASTEREREKKKKETKLAAGLNSCTDHLNLNRARFPDFFPHQAIMEAQVLGHRHNQIHFHLDKLFSTFRDSDRRQGVKVSSINLFMLANRSQAQRYKGPHALAFAFSGAKAQGLEGCV